MRVGGLERVCQDEIRVDNCLLCADDSNLVLQQHPICRLRMRVLILIRHEGGNVLAGMLQDKVVSSRMVGQEL